MMANLRANLSCSHSCYSGRCFLDFPRGCPIMPTLTIVQREPEVSDLVAGLTVSYDADSPLCEVLTLSRGSARRASIAGEA